MIPVAAYLLSANAFNMDTAKNVSTVKGSSVRYSRDWFMYKLYTVFLLINTPGAIYAKQR